ncbi:MAG TPA: Hpt domain-containing protein [Candidatus Limnocylindrales bacterium]|jgi:HPt (histidine-containing phosphotransfer) domain-containing protein
MPEAPIDDAAFAELLETVGGDREFLAELVDTYLADSPCLFAELRAAIAADDAATARRAAHTLKSTSSSFGANGLAALCREIEAVAGAGELAGLEAQVDMAAASYVEVEAALRSAVTAGEAA